MILIKQSEQYNIKDSFKEYEVIGTVTSGKYLTVNIGFNYNDNYNYASYNSENMVSMNITCSRELVNEFSEYFINLISEIYANINKESVE